MATNLKMPPVLESEDQYLEWSNDLKVWQLFTDLAKAKQGPAVYLSLTGRARECVRDLTPEELSANDGVKAITDKLDAIFKKDKNTRAYMAFKEFYDHKRTQGVSITDFIVRFEYLYHKMRQFDMNLPEGVKAFFLLNAANVSEENEKLARATVGELTYDNMKEKIQKIFGDPNADDTTSCKIEPVYYSNGRRGGSWRGKGRDRGSGRGGRGRSDAKREEYYSKGSDGGRSDAKREEYNSKGSDGKPMKCFNCESIKHLSYECPHKKQGSVYITLFGSGYDEQMPLVVQESLGMAVLDSGCTKTVTGKLWLNAYLESLTESDRQTVTYKTDGAKFRFGDGKEVVSETSVQIPAYIDSRRITINTSLVDNDIPLLLSRSAMKRAGMTINFDKDTAIILGSLIKLTISSSGHYCLPLSIFHCSNIVLLSTDLGQMSFAEKKRKAIKLHRQLSHASKEKLKKLAKESKNFNDPEFLKAIEESCDNCEICEHFKKPPLKPIVGLRLADNFNEVVSMDLKEYIHGESWILHLIDTATRYSAACLINTKKQDEIVKKIFSMWITYFGAPCKFLSDNGGEFANATFREMNEKLNVITATTAAESPWSNGIVERHNAVLYESMMKTISDTKCDADIALAWAVSAKNSLQNHDGFSPNQLVFGRNISLPSVLHDELPALEQYNSSDIVRMNLNAMHKARENFVKAESSERIQRALRHKVRSYSDEIFENGDKVYFRRKETKGWKGPAVVLGKDGQFVLIRYGSAMYRVHPCQLIKKQYQNTNQTDKLGNIEQVVRKSNQKVDSKKIEEHVQNDDSDSDTSLNAEVINQEIEETEEQNRNEIESNSENRPKRNSFVRFKMKDKIDWQQAKVLSYQPKQTGKYKQWINVQVENETEPKCVNWDEVEAWTGVEVESVVYLSAAQNKSQEVVDAKEKELENMKRNNVFEEIPFTNQKPVISARWIITEKVKDDKTVVKARLVARGFEEDSTQFKKDSPTCTRESLRIAFMTAPLMKWELNTLDISAAFLQGNEIEREVYLQPPRDVCPQGYVWKLKRCIYGLTDAPRAWYNTVKETLCTLGAKVSLYDNSLFLFHEGSRALSGIVVVHVDDFIHCGNDTFNTNIIGELKKIFKISKEECGTFKYVGLQIKQSKEEIIVNQDFYIKDIEAIPLSASRVQQRESECTSEEKKYLKSLGGKMMWAATQTRPDLSFETCILTNVAKCSKVKTIHDANKAVTKLKSSTVHMKFPSIGSIDDMKIKAYSDATYASLGDGSSQGGYVIFVEGSNRKIIPMCWQSKKLNRVTKSPLASETLALAEAADAAFLVSKMLQEVFQLETAPEIECLTDNASLTATIKTSTTVTDKRLRVDIARLREMVDKSEITISWVDGKEQLADCLTKRGASSQRLLEVLERSQLF